MCLNSCQECLFVSYSFFLLKIEIMNVLERELEDMIWSKIQTKELDLLSDRGLTLPMYSKYYRQYNFSSYGIADIVGFNIEKTSRHWIFNIDIIELKKDEVNVKALCQAARYVKAAQRMANDWNYRHKKTRTILIRPTIHLIGKKVEGGTGFLYLPDIFHDLHLYEYKFSFDEGVYFEQKIDYHLSNEDKFFLPNVKNSIY